MSKEKINTDGWTEKDWELHLNEYEGNIDDELGITIDKVIDVVSDNSEFKSFSDYSKQIQIEKNIKVVIDSEKQSLALYDNINGNIIGSIFISPYKDGDFEKDIHLYNVLEDNYKGMGFGKLMFELYEKLSIEDSDYLLPEEEYTNIVSMINLYKKFGYEPKYKIINGTNLPVELSSEDFSLFGEIVSDYKTGKKEEKLNFTVILEKNY